MATSSGSRERNWQPERSPEKDNLDHFERFCFTLKLRDNKGPFRLDDWELAALEDYFVDKTFETLLELPTGSGKSTLFGALGLHHATYVRTDPRVIVLGGQGKHGNNTLRAARWFVSQSADLSRWWAPQKYGMGMLKSLILEDEEDDVGIFVMSGGGNGRRRAGGSVEGDEWTLLLVEELHRHEDNGAALRTLTTKAVKRSGVLVPARIVHATTAGDNLHTPLGRLRARALDEEAGAVVERDRRPGEFYTYARDRDGDLVAHLWELPEEIDGDPVDYTDLELVKRANPSPMVTVASLRLSLKALAAEPWVFMRQHCNWWVLDDIAYFVKADWRGCYVEGLAIPSGADGVYVGLDMSGGRWDHTGIVPVWIDPATGRPRTAKAVILKPPANGKRRRQGDVADVLKDMKTVWPSMRIVFDRNKGGGLIAETFEEQHGLTVIDHDQGLEMVEASELLGQLVAERGIDQDGNPDLTEHMDNAVAKPVGRGTLRRIAQGTDRTRKVDGAQALAMAVRIALDPPGGVSLDPDQFLPWSVQ